ncbi:leucine-rich repeat, immunoglobulin-like domain and transmembrane domain-containing protein 1a [Pristis pectinata]|uniref:leucine-rich repeat, immunoglobulin-like domain and transmembrane domain-containing protein 1a n=1 Tax=Pristis pectinata TaxID=685728 RepID=UPI00223E8AD0|nr:leucine-rich repeat, immunoglobulin-like domain and transmembrane domain-containing protein 1a [Pristis pectinata]
MVLRKKINRELEERTVLCNHPEMTLIPSNIPADTLKLVIEKTLIKQVSAQAFSSASNLECLRVSFNPISNFSGESLQGLIRLRELRLNGNALSTFPWEALSRLPHLWLLDLHSNVLPSFPTQAATYFKNITYLDLSNNRLTTLSSSVISTWLMVPQAAKVISSTGNSKLIIGLHNNPWECDCRLSELVNFVKMHNPTTALMDPRLKCSRPEHLTGALFSNIELNKCQTPSIHVAEGKVIAVTGSTVSLHCTMTGVPTPTVSWSRLDNNLLNGTVILDNTDKTLKWSTLSLSDVSHQDSSEYLCRASNLMGISSATISLLVVDSAMAVEPIKSTSKRRCLRKMRNQKAATRNRKLMDRYVSTLTSTVSPREMPRGSYSIGRTDYFVMHHHQMNPNQNVPEIVSLKMNPSKINSLLENRRSIDDSRNITSSPPSTQPEADCLVRTVRVIGGTYHSVSLAWRSPKATNITLFSILYTTFGERDMSRINVGPGKTKITIDGLKPQTKYIVCVCVKGIIPKKEQCVIFSTDEVAHASGTQKLINAVVITVACVIVVPLTLIVCCGALKRRCRKFLIKPPEDDYQNNSFVTFESLAMGPGPSVTEEEYMTHHNKDEANRLLSPRSSLDSEEATNNEAQQHEYFC